MHRSSDPSFDLLFFLFLFLKSKSSVQWLADGIASKEDDLLRDRGIRSEAVAVIRGQKTRDQSIIPRGDKGRPVLYNRRTRQWSHVEKVKASVAEPRSTMETSRPEPISRHILPDIYVFVICFLSFLFGISLLFSLLFLIGFSRNWISQRRDAELFNFCALFLFLFFFF